MTVLSSVSLVHSAASALVVHKFGGSSLASSERFHAVADILLAQPQSSAFVVVSAPGDTTDALLTLLDCAPDTAEFELNYQQLVQQLRLLVSRTLTAATTPVVLNELNHWLAAIPALALAGRNNDVLATGEKLSALLLSHLLQERGVAAKPIDARDFLQLCGQQVLWQESEAALRPLLTDGFNVVTGFIARNEAGDSITLGRNGSDYSATILGRLVQAQTIHIWTDVDAIYSADPRKVPSARPYRQVPWAQATLLAELGNPVLHAKTLSPLQQHAADLVVRSSYEPEQPGCKVSRQAAIEVQFVTDLTDVVLVTLPKAVTLTANAVAAQLQLTVFAVPGDANCWVVAQKNLDILLSYLGQQQIYPRVSSEQYQAVAWVKPAAKQQQQLSLQAAHWLERQQPAFSFDNNELALWLFAPALTARELTEFHQLLLPTQVRLNVVVAGTGNVGAEFLALLAKQQQAFAGQIELKLAGVLNSRQACFSDELTVQNWQAQLAAAPLYQQQDLLDYLTALPSPKVLVDITPSKTFAEAYAGFVQTGCHLISANKQGVTLPLAQYQQIAATVAEQQVSWLANTTVGAGLPVQRILQELQSSGDHIQQISGIFSGTLSWLLCKYDGSAAFSDFVLQAQAEGLTEPDPRDDLSGKDVQRKLLVLARELGLTLDINDIALTPLLPLGLEQGSWDEFWVRRNELDSALAQTFTQATSEGKVLRYVATLTVTPQGPVATVQLLSVRPEHPLAAIQACDNVFVIKSNWYQSNPLVLKGPGAGRLVTAGGIHADLAILARQQIAAAKAARHSQAQAAAWANERA
ncbi:bifunctional aspartate kinase/homoserine dehydrogenase II [Rheinheimera sp. 4Y26]|uniref:bifunctional aspartate kinase/homoserine dehydrogenase II n=1 Tax=Rheinheimera sp. 4Y26 TaxID=2977811 RepID=UPI0021B0CE88|nr:bifunctional aspartate kinase/homoserine dehydrogenase II [Rheinheimera sp. 4Y26]MCT6698824.1 bifunctional aspartate kinase/homoserine dehydrogenase II [Rheinheimera sp. 4Y26]